MEQLHEVINKSCNQLDTIQISMNNLKYACRTIGLDQLADTLHKHIEMLHDISDELHKSAGEEITKQFEVAQQSSLNVLNTALAVTLRK